MHRLALALAVLLPLPAPAQERLRVRPEPGTPVVTAQLLLQVGPVDEPEGREGIAYLAARAAVAPVRPLLDSLGARLQVDAHKDALAFSLTAAPDVWEEAARLLMVSVFRDPVDSVSVVRQRAALVEELRTREASPADALVRTLDAAVFGPDHPWSRPAVGTAGTVRRIPWRQVDGFLRDHFLPERAVLSLVGPLEGDEVAAHLGTFLPDDRPDRVYVPAAAPADTAVHVDYNAITAWVGMSYAFEPEVEIEAVRMLADLVLDRVSFGPSRRSVYDARSEVLRRSGGRGELRIVLVVPPREASLWAERVREAVAAYADAALPPAEFAEGLRRFRGRRLLELDSPEARVDALSRMLLVQDGADPLQVGGRLAPESVQEAARQLQPPVVVLLGPFEGERE